MADEVKTKISHLKMSYFLTNIYNNCMFLYCIQLNCVFREKLKQKKLIKKNFEEKHLKYVKPCNKTAC